jgi:hypothetical protein
MFRDLGGPNSVGIVSQHVAKVLLNLLPNCLRLAVSLGRRRLPLRAAGLYAP